MNRLDKRIAVLGAGFAGLSAAYHLKKQGFNKVTVVEASSAIGGLARSFDWHGITCDLAPHRLFTNDQTILDEMLEIVPCHSITRNSKICLSGQWIADPVNAIELITKVPKKQAFSIMFSYAKAVLKRSDTGESFHSFVEAKFGKGLNEIFFDPYAEKLFGIPATQISASWGESKVRVSGIKDMLRRNTKLYFDKFYYPNQGGYGAFVDQLYADVQEQVQLQSKLIELKQDTQNKTYSMVIETDGELIDYGPFDTVINTIPLPRLAEALGHKSDLKYRGAKLVYLLVDQAQVMPQQWVYFVDRNYPINRMAEFKNFMPEAQRKGQQTVICVEVTDHEKYTDEQLIDAVINQLVSLKMIEKDKCIDHKIIPISHAYPVYDLDYAKEIESLDSVLEPHNNIHFIGRQAQFMHQDIDEIYASAKHTVENLFI